MSLASGLSDPLAASRPIQVLAESLERGRLAHAIVLHGDDYGPLEEVANALTREILQPDCVLDAHPDYYSLRPQKRSREIPVGKRENVEPNTIRWLRHQLFQSSQTGRQIAVVHEADRMKGPAANAFLKTLEEPPEGTLLLLLTTRPHDLLPTIRSRCFTLRIPAPFQATGSPEWTQWLDDYRTWLGKLAGLRAKDAIADATMGAFGLAQRFLEIIEGLASEQWKTEKGKLPDWLDDDAVTAQEIGFQRGVRRRLWRELEQATRDFTIERTRLAPETAPHSARAGAVVIAELERVASLLEVYLKEEAAIERFLFTSMRAWR